MNKTTRDLEEELRKKNTKDLLSSFLNVTLNHPYAIALYRLPFKETITGIVSFKGNTATSLREAGNRQGFMVCPFLNGSDNLHFIPADLIFDFTNCSCYFTEDTSDKVRAFLEQVVSSSSEVTMSASPDIQVASPEHYLQITREAIHEINAEKFKKVVLARNKTLSLNENFNPLELFLALAEEQKDSFISLTSLPEQNIWIGASPELLISTDKNRIFRTVALAGTQKAKEDKVSEAVWTQKEIEEQALVIRYIISCFKKIRLREYEEVGPRTVKAGNLLHLRTDFKVNLNEVDRPDLGITMLALLHPTSAVCGMPKEEALEFIRSHEQFDRKFYAGYIGPVNVDFETHIFVNIRCTELSEGKATLYSGAGITAESDPEKELQETELKMQLLENSIIKQNQ